MTRRAILVGALSCVAGCGPRTIDAPRGVHPPNDAVVVPYPPPPAKVEELPARPSPECVWTDGFWQFTDRWEWQEGEWVLPAPHCRLAPPELRREAGQLRYAQPRWYPDNLTLLGLQSACAPPRPCTQISAEKGASNPERR
jgi:hypothetical protein